MDGVDVSNSNRRFAAFMSGRLNNLHIFSIMNICSQFGYCVGFNLNFFREIFRLKTEE